MTIMKQKLKKGGLEKELLLHQVKKIKFNTSFNVTINLSLHWVNICRGKWRQRGHQGQKDLSAFPSSRKFDLVKIKQPKKIIPALCGALELWSPHQNNRVITGYDIRLRSKTLGEASP